MTRFAADVVESLDVNGRGPVLLSAPSILKAVRQGLPYIQAIREAIRNAEKFTFEAVPLEASADGTGTTYRVPAIDKVERECWCLGLVPLPAPVCWFEFKIDGVRTGVLAESVTSSHPIWSVRRFAHDPKTHDGVIWAGTTGMVSPAGDGNPEIRVIPASGTQIQNPEREAAVGAIAIYMALMINSRSTVLVPAAAVPVKVNDKRRKRNREPIDAHTVVRITPQAAAAGRSAGSGSSTPRRLHWRRSHLRHYDHPVPSSKFVEGIEHNGRTGWWVTVIPRHLVGCAEAGVVSHEYRVTE